VRDKAVESIIGLSGELDPSIVAAHLFPLVKRLAQGVVLAVSLQVPQVSILPESLQPPCVPWLTRASTQIVSKSGNSCDSNLHCFDRTCGNVLLTSAKTQPPTYVGLRARNLVSYRLGMHEKGLIGQLIHVMKYEDIKSGLLGFHCHSALVSTHISAHSLQWCKMTR